jgi:metallo-beta-lactamase family protein
MHPECYDDEARAFLVDEQDPFGFTQLQYTRTVQESMALNTRTDPMIIISASGMCETGRILHHLRNNLEDRRNTVLIVGFQAEHTLGKKLVDGVPEVRIFGEEHRVKAGVVVINAFSAHADWQEMREWYRPVGDGLSKTFLVHGNDDALDGMKEHLKPLTRGSITIGEETRTFELDDVA